LNDGLFPQSGYESFAEMLHGHRLTPRVLSSCAKEVMILVITEEQSLAELLPNSRDSKREAGSNGRSVADAKGA
jgi:hypothetical protein